MLTTKSKEHYLFLFEFYVKEVSGMRLAELNKKFSLPTTVRFEFLHFVNDDDLQVTPVDYLFKPQQIIANDVEVFNVGKSVLFAINYDTISDGDLFIENGKIKLDIKFIVKKQMSFVTSLDLDDDILTIGTGNLDLSDQFTALWFNMLKCCEQDETIQTFNGQVPLNHNMELIGQLDVFIRLSSFGQVIVTDFNMPTSEDVQTFMFSTKTIHHNLTFHKVNSCASDFSQNLNKNMQGSVKHPKCQSGRYLCESYEEMMAVEDQIIGDVRMDTTTERKSKNRISKNFHHLSEPCGKPIVLKVSGLYDNGKDEKPTITVADESVPAKPSNSDYDVFVLRIGKKGLVGIGEKSDIQLEMKTPKGPERRQPIRYETREMQTDVKEEEVKDHKKKEKKKRKKKKKKR